MSIRVGQIRGINSLVYYIKASGNTESNIATSSI
jgi:hypothetical protein